MNEEKNIYDVIIIGAGPAGMSAAIYAARRELKTLIISRDLGGQMMWAGEIENYPGYKSIQSFELINNMKEQIDHLGVKIVLAGVKNFSQDDKLFIIDTETEKFYSKAIISTIGLSPRQLEVPGENELIGKGVTYCATCDGPLYRGKDVAVIGGGNAALDAAEMLSKIANKIYIICRSDKFAAFDKLINQVKEKNNIEIIFSSQVKEVVGASKVEKIKIINNTGEEKELEVSGVFVEIGQTAKADLIKDFVDLNQKGQIIVNEKCETKTAGLFAAGDATNIPYKQIVIACGHGAIAALAAYEYIRSTEQK